MLNRMPSDSELIPLVTSALKDGFALFSSDGRIQEVNPAFCKLTGYGREELLGLTPPYPFWRHLADDDVPGAIRRSVEQEVTFQRTDGSRFSALVTARGIPAGGFLALVSNPSQQPPVEERLRQSLQLLADFVENGSVAMHWVGADGTIIWANKAELELLGYAEEEYFGHHISEFHADRIVIDDILCRLTSNEVLKEYEARLRCKDGSIRHVLINSSVLWEDGKFIHTRCFTQDVTERRLAEQRMRTEHVVSRALSEAATTGAVMSDIFGAICRFTGWQWAALWTVDERENVIRCGELWTGLDERPRTFEELCRGTALTPGEGLPGRAWSTARPVWLPDVSISENFPRRAQAIRLGLRGGVAVPVLVSGRVRGVIEFLSREIKPSHQATLEMLRSIGEQIGQRMERDRAEQALRESEHRLRLALEAGQMGTWEWEIATGRVVWSPEMEAIHGLQPGAFAGTVEAVIAHVHPEDRQWVSQYIAQAVDGRQDHHIEYRLFLSDRTVRWVEGRGKLLLGTDGRPERLIGICMDVSERRTAEQRRAELLAREQKTRAELERASRAKDEFLAVLSHELRTPLTPVLTAAQMMERDPRLTSDQHESVVMICRNVELEARLIDDLLDLTRISRGKLQLFLVPADVHQKVRHVAGICDSDVRSKKLNLTLNLAAHPHLVSADPARLQQVLWNLLKNAVKFTPTGGRIILRTDNPAPNRVRIEVSDNGCGIDPAILPTIFDAFVQGGREVTRRHGGLGLGLAITRRLVEMQSGTITASSNGPGQGSTFVVEFPVLQTAIAGRPETKPEGSGGLLKLDGHILLVEDNADTSIVMSKLLRQYGYRVRTADCVASALQAADADTFDLMICDIGLPDGSGLDLMKQIRSRRPIKGIALSGFGMEDDIRMSRDAGFVEHLIKPINVSQLQAAVRRHLVDANEAETLH
jgi:PAS domain S-box-containing protein